MEHRDGSMSDTSVHVGAHVKVAETAVVIQAVVIVARELEEWLLILSIRLALDRGKRLVPRRATDSQTTFNRIAPVDASASHCTVPCCLNSYVDVCLHAPMRQ
jgi:hypothetical protein